MKESVNVAENEPVADQAIKDAPVRVNERGFMTDPSQWTPGVAWNLARRQGVANWPRELTSEHWQVIDYTRAYFQAVGNAPSLRYTCKALGLAKKRFSRLFPGGLMTVRRIAGLPGPRRSASGRELSIAQQLLASDWWEHLTSAEVPDGPPAGKRSLLPASPVPARSPSGVPVAVKGATAGQ